MGRGRTAAASRWRNLVAATVAVSCPLLGPAPPASGDIGVTRVSPRHARPGERVTVSIRTGGSIRSPARALGPFPVSLVPLAEAPRPHACGTRTLALCLPASVGPPKAPPFVFLGQAKFAKRQSNRSLGDFRLPFPVPALRPGTYVFVIYSGGAYPGTRGGLVIDYGSDASTLLQVHRAGDGADGGDGERALWLVAAAGACAAIALLRSAVRRRKA